jgi:predicted transcriptional regulator
MATTTRRAVLEYVRNRPDATISTIAREVGVTWRTARKYLNEYHASRQGLLGELRAEIRELREVVKQLKGAP